MFLTFLIILFTLIMVAVATESMSNIVIFLTYGKVDVTPEIKAENRKEALCIVGGGAMLYCLTVIAMCL